MATSKGGTKATKATKAQEDASLIVAHEQNGEPIFRGERR